MAKVTKEQIEQNIQDITDTFDRKISEVRNDGLAPESVKEIKINELEKKKKEKIEKERAKLKATSEGAEESRPKKNALMEAAEATRKNTLGYGAEEVMRSIAESNGGDSERVAENTRNAIERGAEAVRSYDAETGTAASKKDIEKAQEKAKTISEIADKDFDVFATWDEYYKALKDKGLSDEQIKIKLKGSKWETSGKAYNAWKNSTSPAPEAEKPNTEPKDPPPAAEDTIDIPDDKAGNVASEIERIDTKDFGTEDKNNFLTSKSRYSDYLNTSAPNTFGLIFGDSGLSTAERIAVGLSVLGKIVGNTLLANGMSLLGDNSYFSRIGEGVGIENYVSDNAKDYAESMNKAIIDVSKEVERIDTITSPLISAAGLELDGKQKAVFFRIMPNVASQGETEGVEMLKRYGFSDSAARKLYKVAKDGAKSFKETQETTQGATETTKKTYELTKEMFSDANELRAKIIELKQMKQNISSGTMNERLDYMQKYGSMLSGIGSVSSMSGVSESVQKSLNASLSAAPAIFNIGASGGASWADSSNKSTSETFNKYLKEGIDEGSREFKSWWQSEGKKLQEDSLRSIDLMITALEDQIKALGGSTGSTGGKSDERLKTITTERRPEVWIKKIEWFDGENPDDLAMYKYLGGGDDFDYCRYSLNDIENMIKWL